MKNLAKIFMMVAALFAFSCTTDVTEDLGVQLGDGAGQTTITLSLEESRTQLGEKAGDLYPLYWSEGDAIAANGYVSNTLTAEQAGSAGATFSFAEVVARPWCVVYPAPAAVAAEEVVEGEGETTPATVYPVEFLATQPYTVGSFAPKAAPMYAYAVEAAEGEEIAPIQLHHLTGVLRLAVKGNSEAITSVTVKALNGKIAGPFTIDCATGALTALEGAGDTVTMTFAEPLVLGAEAAPIYLTVPAGSHGVFLATLHTANNKMTVKFNSDIKPITAGAVREFGEFVYTANTADENGGVFEIDSKEALIEFARIASVFAPRAEAKVVANIDMSGYDWKPIENFGEFVFDGGSTEGYKISGLSAPLFGTTAATIKNVALDGINWEVTDRGISGAIVCKLYGGKLINCSADGTININCANLVLDKIDNTYHDICYGGLVGYISGATVDGCINNVDISITQLFKAGQNIKSAVGGIAGSYANNSTLTNLTNNGNIEYNEVRDETTKGTIFISGIVGRNDDSAGADLAAMSYCTNNGTISSHKDSSTPGTINLAGIIGFFLDSQDIVCTNLTNNGAITHNGSSAQIYLGGIVSRTADIHLKDCSNSAAITVSSTADVGETHVAGIVGGDVEGTFDNCDNSGAISINTAINAESTSCILSGVIGELSDAEVKNCDNTGAIYLADQTLGGRGYYFRIGGVVATNGNANASVTNCTNGDKDDSTKGSITVGAVPAGVGTAGVVGYFQKVISSLSGCKNYGTIKQTGLAGHPDRFAGIAGVAGLCYSTGGLTITNCENHGLVQYACTTDDTNLSYTFVGGVVAANLHPITTITGCKNYGTVEHFGRKAVKNSYSYLGGIIAYVKSDATIENCVNGKGAIVHCAGCAVATMAVGGILGITATGSVVKGCVNLGEVKQSKDLNGPTFIGGIIGYSLDVHKIENCENRGPINIGNTASANIYVGGITGSTTLETASLGTDITLKNCANYYNLEFTGTGNNYYAGTIAGLIRSRAAGSTWGDVSGLKNVADITFSGTAKNAYYGGLFGNVTISKSGVAGALANINNCVFYGDLKALDLKGKVGMIMGNTRSDNATAKSCKIGGSLIFEQKTTTGGTDEEGNSLPDTVELTPGALNADNWYMYIYTSEITKAVAEGDGCSLLTEKPTVPTPTLQ